MENIILKKIRNKMVNDSKTEGKLGTTIKLKRKERNKNLQKLNDIVGVSVSYISKVENNLITPNLTTIKGVLETLEINEKAFESSLVMDKWYLKTIKDILAIKNYQKQLFSYLNERNDFQAKLINFALKTNKGAHQSVSEEISLLMYSVDQMTNLEFVIFLLSLIRYHINDEDYLNAQKIFIEIKSVYLTNSYLSHWHAKLKFELALMQADLHVLQEAKDNYLKYLFLHNKLTKIKAVRTEYISALAYFYKPNDFYLIDEKLYQRSKRISLVLNEKFNDFKKLPLSDDLALLLYYDYQEDDNNVIKLLPKVKFLNTIFETALLDYFTIKYDDEADYCNFLKEKIFSCEAITQHYYGLCFFANKLKEILLKEFKYKEVNLINELVAKRKFNL